MWLLLLLCVYLYHTVYLCKTVPCCTPLYRVSYFPPCNPLHSTFIPVPHCSPLHPNSTTYLMYPTYSVVLQCVPLCPNVPNCAHVTPVYLSFTAVVHCSRMCFIISIATLHTNFYCCTPQYLNVTYCNALQLNLKSGSFCTILHIVPFATFYQLYNQKYQLFNTCYGITCA